MAYEARGGDRRRALSLFERARRVFALEGDGSLLMQLGCLTTIAGEKLWTTTPNLVFDKHYNVGLVGFCLGDRELIDWGLNDSGKPFGPHKGGFYPVMDTMIRDGHFWAEAPIYALVYDVHSMLALAEAARGAGFADGAKAASNLRKHGVGFWAAPNCVTSPQFAFMAKGLAAGKLGRVAAAHADYGHEGPDWSAFFYEKGGGSMADPKTGEMIDEATIKIALMDLAKGTQAGMVTDAELPTAASKLVALFAAKAVP
mgnify:CR=1 FL=1